MESNIDFVEGNVDNSRVWRELESRKEASKQFWFCHMYIHILNDLKVLV